MPIKEWSQKCKSCKGTGLYVGFAEKEGAAVVCHSCKGTGEQKMRFEYEEFQGRADRIGVTRVYQTNPGIGVDGKGTVSGGVPIKEWEADPEAAKAPGKEMRSHTCPAWWYQSTDDKKKPEWDSCLGIGAFYDCKYFPKKGECWVRWDTGRLLKGA